MKIINGCYNCFHGIVGADGRRDEPPTLFGCMLKKDECIRQHGFVDNCDCFTHGQVTDKEMRIRINQFLFNQTRKVVIT